MPSQPSLHTRTAVLIRLALRLNESLDYNSLAAPWSKRQSAKLEHAAAELLEQRESPIPTLQLSGSLRYLAYRVKVAGLQVTHRNYRSWFSSVGDELRRLAEPQD